MSPTQNVLIEWQKLVRRKDIVKLKFLVIKDIDELKSYTRVIIIITEFCGPGTLQPTSFDQFWETVRGKRTVYQLQLWVCSPLCSAGHALFSPSIDEENPIRMLLSEMQKQAEYSSQL